MTATFCHVLSFHDPSVILMSGMYANLSDSVVNSNSRKESKSELVILNSFPSDSGRITNSRVTTVFKIRRGSLR